MPSVKSILHNRAARRSRKSIVGRIALTAIWFLGALIIAGMFGAFLIGLFFGLITNDLPQASDLDLLFSDGGDEFPGLSYVYDRTNEEQLFPLLNPSGLSRKWLSSNLEDPNPIPLNLIVPLLAYQDDTFWVHDGFDGRKIFQAIVEILKGADEHEVYRSIPQRLAEITILPAKDFQQGTLIRFLKSAILAQALDETYSKDQLLEWYFNLADFGNFAFGADAASLLYYGKHAAQLSAGEGAMLAAVPVDPGFNPIDNYARARENQIFILGIMQQRGLISQDRLLAARSEPKPFSPVLDEHGLMKFVEQRLRLILGSGLIARPGLRITTTIDQQLQFELQCTASAYLNLAGSPNPLLEASSGTCSAEQLLPRARADRQGIERGAIIVLDPIRGEILGSYGLVDSVRGARAMLNPFSYLTAFSKGFSPGTMVLDLPVEQEQDSIQAQGPARMRSALVGGYPYAADRVVQLVGEKAVLEVLEQMGITDRSAAPVASAGFTTSLLDLANGYSVIANQGRMVGQNQPATAALKPTLITKIVDGTQLEIYLSARAQRSIISPSLAYLLVDVLRDSAARRKLFGNANVFELEPVSAVVIENFAQPKADNWTIGFTSARVVGVWVGNSSAARIGVLDGSAPLWHAIMEYVSQNAGSQGWEIPADVRTLEVCDPSGLLPTQHCPNRVQEIFLAGTEPLHSDDLFQAIRVNRETGKLATVFTPWNLAEERLYFLPPSEAAAWAKNNGFESPPTEYDPTIAPAAENDGVSIDFPTHFATVRGRVFIRGSASGVNFNRYRLAYGQGLNPTTWFLIDEQVQAIEGASLGVWDTEGLDGIITLQLIAVDADGMAAIVYRQITVDNQSPQIESFSVRAVGQTLVLSADATDNIAPVRVDFYLNGLKMASSKPPFEAAISFESGERYEAFARVYDAAGNQSENSALIIVDTDF